MQVQHVSPLPPDPLATLASDYPSAILHVAWDLNKGTGERTLLFACVELLPEEVPPPEDDGDIGVLLGRKGGHRVFVRHAVVPSAQAIAWYLGCRRGIAVLPEDDGRLPHAEDEGTRRLRLSDLAEEPPWPNLVCLDAEQTSVPFAPQWQECPRLHHLVPLVDLDLSRLWTQPRERQEGVDFLCQHLHFDVNEYPEYIGSVHLVAPNPVFRELDIRLRPGAPPLESVLFRFHARAGKDLAGLQLFVREERPTGDGALSAIPVEEPIVKVRFEQGISAIAGNVIDAQRGPLRISREAHTFIHSIQIGLAFTEATRVVQGHTPEEAYEVNIHSEPESMTVGEDYRAPPGRMRLWSAHHAREQKARARAQHQRWFSGQKDEARRVLQELLHGAHREVMIVDPYFAADELRGFAPVVGQYTVPISILTSAEILKNVASTGPEEKGEALVRELSHLAASRSMNPLRVRVMTGSRPEIHDRFLLVDDRLWLLGSSLNEFGSRGTMMVALPDPTQVRDKLRAAWNDAEPLERWIEGRRERRSDAAAEEE